MMDAILQASPPGNTDTKSAFRKPFGDAANRNYRRHSPIDESPSSDASPKRERRASPSPLREDSVRVSDHHSRKDDDREQDRHYGRNHYSRSSDSFRHSDRQSFRCSYGHSRHEDYIRQDKYPDEDRYHERLSSRYGHESRGDRAREEGESRSKDYLRGAEKYSRDKFDRSDYRSKEKDRETSSLEHHKCKDKDSSSDRSGYGRRHAASDDVKRERHTRDWEGRDERRDSYRSDLSNSESRRQRDDSGSRRDSSKRHLKEAYKSEHKEQDGQMIPWEEKKKYDDFEISKNRDRNPIKLGEQFGNEDNESYVKKQKLFDKGDNDGKDDERQTSSSKLSQDSNLDLKTAHASGSEGSSDLNAAKVAAMKAAELVNRNLVGVGCLTTDQKKKLLWGSKKNTTAEESGHRWDASLFSDRERQEKFNKLMGVKGDPKVEQNSNNQHGNDLLHAEKQRELQLDLEKQYTAGLRRRDGRTVGLGL